MAMPNAYSTRVIVSGILVVSNQSPNSHAMQVNHETTCIVSNPCTVPNSILTMLQSNLKEYNTHIQHVGKSLNDFTSEFTPFS